MYWFGNGINKQSVKSKLGSVIFIDNNSHHENRQHDYIPLLCRIL